MKKTLILIVFLGVSMTAHATDIVGRYQFILGTAPPEKYVIDTQTGKVWVISGLLSDRLKPMTYIIDGKQDSPLPPVYPEENR